MNLSTLGEICDRTGGSVQTGPFGSQVHQADYKDDGVPVVMPQDIINDRISTERIAHIDDALANKLERHLLVEGDIVFPRRGEISKRAIVDKSQVGYFCGTGCLKISVTPVEILPKWFFYFLGQEHIVKWIEGKAIGATMLNLNTGILRSLPVQYPGIDSQIRIVECLSAYDDLIAINQRRIALLENAARRLYREWFVQLRFPGHESVPVRDGVPEGWHVLSLSSICEELRDMVDPTAISAETSYLSMEHMPQKSISFGVWESAQKVGSTKLRFQTDDVLFGKIRPYFHKVGLAPIAGITSTDVIVVRVKNAVTLPLVLMIMSSDSFVDHAVATSNGTKMPRADWKILRQWPVIFPDEVVLRRFHNLVTPMLDKMKALMFQSRSLAQARDLLLPKLMSGQLDVSGIPLPDDVAA